LLQEHTTGFGSKILNKLGFTGGCCCSFAVIIASCVVGRLGKNESGPLNPILLAASAAVPAAKRAKFASDPLTGCVASSPPAPASLASPSSRNVHSGQTVSLKTYVESNWDSEPQQDVSVGLAKLTPLSPADTLVFHISALQGHGYCHATFSRAAADASALHYGAWTQALQEYLAKALASSASPLLMNLFSLSSTMRVSAPLAAGAAAAAFSHSDTALALMCDEGALDLLLQRLVRVAWFLFLL
jgi:hypothetical protein